VAPEVVHHDNVTRRESWHENLLDISPEPKAVDRAVEHKRRGQSGSKRSTPPV
jgi:hypothetical protein